jgi:kanosamine-6-phosphate phosphatase
VNTVVCCDLDETYIPFAGKHRSLGGVHELEQFLIHHGAQKGIVIGWVTGTNLQSALRKAQGYISRSPHFICCSLGSEFYWVRNGVLIPSQTWHDRIVRSGFSARKVAELLTFIREQGIVLKRQPQDYQGPFKFSFYYQMNENMDSELQWMGKAASNYRVRGQFTQCNPAAGDPADCYDVDFIPQCCGKDEALSFIMERLNVSQENIWAFGDSCNDFAMFERAGKGYLVANADPAAKQQMGDYLALPYCHGILSVLETL